MSDAWPPDVEDIYELSPLQEGILFHALYDPASRVYVEQVSFRLDGVVHLPAFNAAWRQVFERHAALRTAFHWQDLDRPLQVVRRQVAASVAFEDWRGMTDAALAARVETFRADDCARGFDLSTPPLLRVTVLQTSDSSSLLTLTFHHIVLDGWSLQILNREFRQIYDAARRGERVTLAPVRPFGDLIASLQRKDWREAKAFWADALADCRPARLDVATGPLAASGGTSPVASTAEWIERVDEEQTRALTRMAQERRITLHTVVCAAWALVLSRYTGSRDVVFGTVVSGRSEPLPGIESMVGLFLNTIPVRARIAPGVPVGEWLADLHARAVKAGRYEQTPLVDVRDAAGWPRDEEPFDTLLALENHVAPGAAAAEPLHVRHASTYPLDVTILPGARLTNVLAYDPARLDCTTVANIARDFRLALERLPGDVQRPLHAVLPPVDVDLARFAGPASASTDWRGGVHEQIAAQAVATPDVVALVFEDATITYAALDRRVTRLAHALRRAGVGPEVRVGLCLERSIELVIAILATLRAGGAYVPLEPEYPSARLAALIADAQPAHILVQERHRSQLGAVDVPFTIVDGADDAGDGAHDDRAEDDVEVWPRVEAAQACYMIYTSGSTGQPKGAVNVHEGLRNRLDWMQDAYPIGAGDVVLQKTPFSFDVSVWEFLWPLMHGATLVVARPGGHRDPAYLADLIDRAGVTTLHFVPSMLEAFVTQAAELRTAGRHSGRSLRQILCSGEALSPTLAARTLMQWPAALHNLYGPTEASIDVTAWTCTLDELTASARAASSVPLGHAIAQTQVYVLDDEQQLVPTGVTGEIALAGVGLGRGYWRRPDLTADRFVPNPHSDAPGTRLYRTGDLGRYRADGVLEFLGRRDSQVKIRGHRIELGEIEAALRAQPGVQDAVVVVRPDAPGGPQLVAYVVARGATPPAQAAAVHQEVWDHDLGHRDLRHALRARLPEYLVPAVFVALDALPVSAHGKLDRRALPAPPAPGASSAADAPRTAIEELLAGIWADVLGLDRVGIHDNFFELGGHSIIATRLVSRVNAALGLRLPLRALFDAPTIAALADEWTHEQTPAATSVIQRVPRDADLPLSFAQQRLWFLQQLDPESWAYNVATPMRFRGPVDRAALASAVERLIARHEILRTSIASRLGSPVQVVHPPGPAPLAFVDLGDAPPAERERRARVLAHEDARLPFDLARAPLLRATLIRLDADEHVLLLTLHHIVTDGWSAGILMTELSRLYADCADGHASALPELPLQYADYAVWQRSWLTGDALDAQIAYWRRHLAGAPPRLHLPALAARAASFSAPSSTLSADSPAGTHVFSLPETLARRVDALGRREGVTMFMVLLAALGVLLRQYGDDDDLVFGSPFAGRTRPELEGIVGVFVNTLPLRLTLAGRRTFADVLRDTREACLGAYANQDVPFDRLVEELRPPRDAARHPIYQVVFTFQNAPKASGAPGHMAIEPFDSLVGTAKFDLVINIWPRQDGAAGAGLAGSVEYARDVFDADGVARMFVEYGRLLGSFCADPDMELSEVDLLSPDERRLVSRRTTIDELNEPLFLHD